MLARRGWICKFMSVLVAAAFLLEQIGWTQDGKPVWQDITGTPISRAQDPLSNIDVPNDIGQVDQSVIRSGSDVIINIQDAHASLSAQFSIAGILDSLLTSYDLNLVAVEGASEGYLDTSLLQTFPDKKIRDDTAGFLMKEGRMSAGEFFAITRDGADVMLYGVEDDELYKKDLESFRAVSGERAARVENCEKLLGELDTLAEKIYSPELLALERKSALHRKGELSFSEYWAGIKELAASKGITPKDSPNIEKLLVTMAMEKRIDFAKANDERKKLIDELSARMEKKDIEALVLKSLAFKQNKISQGDFHAYLGRLAQAYNISPEEYPNLITFTEYVTLYQDIDIIVLHREFAALEERIRTALYRSDIERGLSEWTRLIRIIERLYTLELSTDETAFMENARKDCDGGRLAAFLRKASAESHVPLAGGYDLAGIFSGVDSALEFYKVAEERNNAMLANTLKRMRAEGKHVAALITGGYHTQGLTELMKKGNLSYLVIVPKFETGKERPYVAVLTNKKKPYEELLEAGKYQLAVRAYFDDRNEDKLMTAAMYALASVVREGGDWKYEAEKWQGLYAAEYERLKAKAPDNVRNSLDPARLAEMLGIGKEEGQGELRIEKWKDSVLILRMKDGNASFFLLDQGESGILDSPRVLSPSQGNAILAALDLSRKKKEEITGRVSDLEERMGKIEEELARVRGEAAGKSREDLVRTLESDYDLLVSVTIRTRGARELDDDRVVRGLNATPGIKVPQDWKNDPVLAQAIRAFAGSVKRTDLQIRFLPNMLRDDKRIFYGTAQTLVRKGNFEPTDEDIEDAMEGTMPSALLSRWRDIPELKLPMTDFMTRIRAGIASGDLLSTEEMRHFTWTFSDETMMLLDRMFWEMARVSGVDIATLTAGLSGTPASPKKTLEIGSGQERPVYRYFNGDERVRSRLKYGDGIKMNEVTSIDMAAIPDMSTRLFHGNFLAMKMFPSGMFDDVVCANVLNEECYSMYMVSNERNWKELFPNEPFNEGAFYRKVALELYRVTKPGAKVYMVLGQSKNPELEKAMRYGGFKRVFSSESPYNFKVFEKIDESMLTAGEAAEAITEAAHIAAMDLKAAIAEMRALVARMEPAGGESAVDARTALRELIAKSKALSERIKQPDSCGNLARSLRMTLTRGGTVAAFDLVNKLAAIKGFSEIAVLRDGGKVGKEVRGILKYELSKLEKIANTLAGAKPADVVIRKGVFYEEDIYAYARDWGWGAMPPADMQEWMAYFFFAKRATKDDIGRISGNPALKENFENGISIVTWFNRAVLKGDIKPAPGEEGMFARALAFLEEMDPAGAKEVVEFVRARETTQMRVMYTAQAAARLADALERNMSELNALFAALPREGRLTEDQKLALAAIVKRVKAFNEEISGEELWGANAQELKATVVTGHPIAAFDLINPLAPLSGYASMILHDRSPRIKSSQYEMMRSCLTRLNRVTEVMKAVTPEKISFVRSPLNPAKELVSLRDWGWDAMPPADSLEWISYLCLVKGCSETEAAKLTAANDLRAAFDEYVRDVTWFNMAVLAGDLKPVSGEEAMFESAKDFLSVRDASKMREIGEFARGRLFPGAKPFIPGSASPLFTILGAGALLSLMSSPAGAAETVNAAAGAAYRTAGLFIGANTVISIAVFLAVAVTLKYVSAFIVKKYKIYFGGLEKPMPYLMAIFAFAFFFCVFNIPELRATNSAKDLLRTPVANMKQLVDSFISEKPRSSSGYGVEHSLVSIKGIPGDTMWAGPSARMKLVAYSDLKGYVPPEGYEVFGVFNTAPQADGKHTTLVGENGKELRARNAVSTRAGGAFYVRYSNGVVRLVRNTDTNYAAFLLKYKYSVAVQAGPMIKENGVIQQDLPKESTSRLYVGVNPRTNETKFMHVGSGVTGYSGVLDVLKGHFADYPDVCLWDAGQYDISKMFRDGSVRIPMSEEGKELYALVVEAKPVPVSVVPEVKAERPAAAPAAPAQVKPVPPAQAAPRVPPVMSNVPRVPAAALTAKQSTDSFREFVKNTFKNEIVGETFEYDGKNAARKKELFFSGIFANAEARARVQAVNRWIDANWNAIKPGLPAYAMATRGGFARPEAQQKALFILMAMDPEGYSEYLEAKKTALRTGWVAGVGYTTGSRGFGMWGVPVIQYSSDYKNNYLGIAETLAHEGVHAGQLRSFWLFWWLNESTSLRVFDIFRELPSNEPPAFKHQTEFMKNAINVVPAKGKEYLGDDAFLMIGYMGQKWSFMIINALVHGLNILVLVETIMFFRGRARMKRLSAEFTRAADEAGRYMEKEDIDEAIAALAKKDRIPISNLPGGPILNEELHAALDKEKVEVIDRSKVLAKLAKRYMKEKEKAAEKRMMAYAEPSWLKTPLWAAAAAAVLVTASSLAFSTGVTNALMAVSVAMWGSYAMVFGLWKYAALRGIREGRVTDGRYAEGIAVRSRSIMEIPDEELLFLTPYELNRRHIRRIIALFDVLWPLVTVGAEKEDVRHYREVMDKFIIAHSIGSSYGSPGMAALARPIDDSYRVLSENGITLPLEVDVLLRDSIFRDKKAALKRIRETRFSEDPSENEKAVRWMTRMYVIFAVSDSIEMGADYLRGVEVRRLKGEMPRAPQFASDTFAFISSKPEVFGLRLEDNLSQAEAEAIKKAMTDKSAEEHLALARITALASNPVTLPAGMASGAGVISGATGGLMLTENDIVRERVSEIFSRLSHELLGKRYDLEKGPARAVIVDDDSPQEDKKALRGDYAAFDPAKNTLYVMGKLARAPDWALAPILSHEVAHRITKIEILASLFALISLPKAVKTMRSMEYGPEEYRILASIDKNTQARYVQEHSIRNSRLAVLLARRMKEEGYGITEADTELLRTVFLAHDSGGNAEARFPSRVESMRTFLRPLLTEKLGGDAARVEEHLKTHNVAVFDGRFEEFSDLMHKLSERNEIDPFDADWAVKYFYTTNSTLANLRNNRIMVPLEAQLLIRFHHSYGDFEKYAENASSQELPPAVAERVRKLLPVVRAVDVFENGQNSFKRYNWYHQPYEDLNQTFSFLDRTWQKEGIDDRSVLASLRRMAGDRSKDLFDIMTESRETRHLESQDKAFIESASEEERLKRMRDELWGDQGKIEHAVMLFKMGIPEELRVKIIRYLESKGFEVERAGRLDGVIGMDTVLKRWGKKSGLEYSVIDIEKDGIDASEARAALENNDGARFYAWFEKVEKEHPDLASVKGMKYSIEILNRGIEAVILRSRVPRRELVREFGSENDFTAEELDSLPFQDIFKKAVVGATDSFRAKPATIRGRIISPALGPSGEMADIYNLGAELVDKRVIGFIANGVHCPRYDEMPKEITDYFRGPSAGVTGEVAIGRPATIPSFMRVYEYIFKGGRTLTREEYEKYVKWIAPVVEEALFLALPMAIGHLMFGITSSWMPILMLMARGTFFVMHEGARPHAPPRDFIFPFAVAVLGVGLPFFPPLLSVLSVNIGAVSFISSATLFAIITHSATNFFALHLGFAAAAINGEARLALARLADRVDTAPDDEKIAAIRQVTAIGTHNAIPIVIKAIDSGKAGSAVKLAAIEALAELKRITVPKRSQAEIHSSVVGIIYNALDELKIDRGTVRVTGPYERMKIKFDRPTSPVVKISRLKNLLGKKFRDADLGVNIESPDNVTVELVFDLNGDNLTAFWRALGSMDFKTDAENNYRKLSSVEIVEKVEDRTRMLLDGLGAEMKAVEKGSEAHKKLQEKYRTLYFFVYGDGTEKNPGLVNIMKHPEKLREVDEEEIEARYKEGREHKLLKEMNGKKFVSYGDSQVIRTESMVRGGEAANCSFNDMRTMARSNPYFAYYVRNMAREKFGATDAVKKWIYLARAAGSVFQTAYTMNIMRGMESNDYMFFISRDTLGHFSTDLRNVLDSLASHADDFEGLQAMMLATLDRLYNNKENWKKLFDAIWEQLQATNIMEGVRPGETVMVVDEIANGTYDFMLKYIVEKKTREADEARFLAEVSALVQSGVPLEEAEKSVEPAKPVTVQIFVGKPRTLDLPGYPQMVIEKVMKDFGLSRDEAVKIIEAISTIADFMPHPLKVSDKNFGGEFRPDDEMRPAILTPEIYMELEENDVLIGSYLKALLAMNGIVEYYDTAALYPVVNLMRVDSDPAVRRAAAEALARFSRPELAEEIKNALTGISASETDDTVRAEAERSYIKVLSSQLKGMVSIGPSGEVKLEDVRRLLGRMEAVVSALESPYPGARDFAEKVLSSLNPKAAELVARKKNALPVDSGQVMYAARKSGFAVPAVNIGLGKVSLLFQTEAILEAARDNDAAVAFSLSANEFDNFDYETELSPIDRTAEITERVFGNKPAVYFYHLEDMNISSVSDSALEKAKGLITRALEQGYTSVSLDTSRLYVEGRLENLDEEWDESHELYGIFRTVKTHKEGENVIEEMEVLAKGYKRGFAGMDEDWLPIGTLRVVNGRIESVPDKLERYFTSGKLVVRRDLTPAEHFEQVTDVSAKLYRHMLTEARRLGISVGKEATVGEVGVGSPVFDAVTGKTVTALTTPEDVKAFSAGVRDKVNMFLPQNKEISKPFDMVAVNNGLTHGYVFGEDDRLLPASAGKVDPAVTLSIASANDIEVTQHGSSGMPASDISRLAASGVGKFNFNTDFVAIIFRVLEVYAPDVYAELFAKARERAAAQHAPYVTNDAGYDLAHAKNRIMYGQARYVLSDSGRNRDYTLVNKIKNALQDSAVLMDVDGGLAEDMTAQYIVHDLKFRPSPQGLTAPEMIHYLTYMKAKNIFEDAGSRQSLFKMRKEAPNKFLGVQIASLLHRKEIFSQIGTTDVNTVLDAVADKTLAAYDVNLPWGRPTIAAFLGAQGSGKKYLARKMAEKLDSAAKISGKDYMIRNIAMEDAWLLPYSRREDQGLFGRFDLKGELGFRSFMQNIRNGRSGYIPFFDQAKRKRFRFLDTDRYTGPNGDEDEDAIFPILRAGIEKLKSSGARERHVREATLLQLFDEKGNWLVKDEALKKDLEKRFDAIDAHGGWARDIDRTKLFIDITPRKNGRLITGDIVERIDPTAKDIFLVTSRLAGSDEVFLPEEREELFDVLAGVWAPPETRRLKLLKQIELEGMYRLTPRNRILAMFDKKLVTEEVPYIDPMLRNADIVYVNLSGFDEFLFSDNHRILIPPVLLNDIYLSLMERYAGSEGQAAFERDRERLEAILGSYGQRDEEGRLLADGVTVMERIKNEILSEPRATATMPSIKRGYEYIVNGGRALTEGQYRTYVTWIAPVIEEGIFFALPLVVGNWLFGLGSFWTIAAMAFSRIIFYLEHPGALPHAPPREYITPRRVAAAGFALSLFPVLVAATFGSPLTLDPWNLTLITASSFISVGAHAWENIKALAAGRAPAVAGTGFYGAANVPISGTPFYEAWHKMVKGMRPELPPLSEEARAYLESTPEGHDFVQNYEKIMPGVRYLFEEMSPEERDRALLSAGQLVGLVGADEWKLGDFEKLHGLRAMARGLLTVIFNRSDGEVPVELKNSIRGMIYGVSLLALYAESSVCAARIERAAGGMPDIVRSYLVCGELSTPENTDRKDYVDALSALQPYKYVFDRKVRESLAGKNLLRTSVKGTQMEAYTSPDLPFVIKVITEGGVNTNREPAVFVNDVLPQVMLARQKLGGLAANALPIRNLKVMIDGKERVFESAVIQRKVVPLRDMLQRLDWKDGDPPEEIASKKERIEDLVSKWWALADEIHKRGVIDMDPKISDNYGYDEDRDAVVILDFSHITEDKERLNYDHRYLLDKIKEAYEDPYWLTEHNEKEGRPATQHSGYWASSIYMRLASSNMVRVKDGSFDYMLTYAKGGKISVRGWPSPEIAEKEELYIPLNDPFRIDGVEMASMEKNIGKVLKEGARAIPEGRISDESIRSILKNLEVAMFWLYAGREREEMVRPASIPLFKKRLAPKMLLDEYAVKIAPLAEEAVFFAVPLILSNFAFGLESLWSVAVMLFFRTAFFFMHPAKADIVTLSSSVILGFLSPVYKELKKHITADWKFARPIALRLGIEEGSDEMEMLRTIVFAHDIGGILGYKPDEKIESKLLGLAAHPRYNILPRMAGRPPKDILAEFEKVEKSLTEEEKMGIISDLAKKGREIERVELTDEEKAHVPNMDHPSESLRMLEALGVEVPAEVKRVIARHMDSPSEEELMTWSERERRLFACFALADVFECGNNYYKQKGGFYKHAGKFEEPSDTLAFIRNKKFKARTSLKPFIDAAEELIQEGALKEAFDYSRSPIVEAEFEPGIMSRAPPSSRIVPFVTAAFGCLLSAVPLAFAGVAQNPLIFMSSAAFMAIVFHAAANVIAVNIGRRPAAITTGYHKTRTPAPEPGITLSDTPFYKAWESVLNGKEPSFPELGPELKDKLRASRTGTDFIYNYNKITPSLRYLFHDLDENDRAVVLKFLNDFALGQGIRNWTLSDFEKLHGIRSLLRTLLVVVYNADNVSARVKRIVRGIAYGMGLLPLFMEHSVCISRIEAAESGQPDLIEAIKPLSLFAPSAVPGEEVYRRKMVEITPYHYIFEKKVRETVAGKKLKKLDPEGSQMVAYSSDELPFVVKVLKPGGLNNDKKPLVFDRDILPGVNIARTRLGGLAANALVIKNLVMNVDGKEVLAEEALIQTKVVTMRHKLEALAERYRNGDESAGAEAERIIRKWWELQTKMWKRGVVDADIKLYENYGYDEWTDSVFIFDYTNISTDVRAFWNEDWYESIIDVFRKANISVLGGIGPPGMKLKDAYMSAEFDVFRRENIRIEGSGDDMSVSVWPSAEDMKKEDMFIPLNDPFTVDSKELGRMMPALSTMLGESAFGGAEVSDGQLSSMLSTLVYNMLWFSADRQLGLAGQTIHPTAGVLRRSMADQGIERSIVPPAEPGFPVTVVPGKGIMQQTVDGVKHVLGAEDAYAVFGLERMAVKEAVIENAAYLVGRDLVTLKVVGRDGSEQRLGLVLYKSGYNLDASIEDPYEKIASRLLQLYRDFSLGDYDLDLREAGLDPAIVTRGVEDVIRKKLSAEVLTMMGAGFDCIVYTDEAGSLAIKEMNDEDMYRRRDMNPAMAPMDRARSMKGYGLAGDDLGHLFTRFVAIPQLKIRVLDRMDDDIEDRTVKWAIIQKSVPTLMREGYREPQLRGNRFEGILGDTIGAGDIETAKRLIDEYLVSVRGMMTRGVFDWDIKTSNYGYDPSVGRVGSLDASRFKPCAEVEDSDAEKFLEVLIKMRHDIYDWTFRALDPPRAKELRDYIDKRASEVFSTPGCVVDISREGATDSRAFARAIREKLSAGKGGIPVCYAGPEYMRGDEVKAIAAHLKASGADVNRLGRIFAVRGFSDAKTFYERSKLLNDPYIPSGRFYLDMQNGPYLGAKVRELGQYQRAGEAVLTGRYGSYIIPEKDLENIRKDMVKTLIRVYDHGQQVYDTLAVRFGLDRKKNVMDKLDIEAEFSKIPVQDITSDQKSFLADMFGITEITNLKLQLSIAFDEIMEEKRYPFDISLDNFIVKRDGDKYSVELESFGSLVRKGREFEIVNHMHQYLLIPYPLIFEAVREEKGARAAAVFCERVFFQAGEGTELQRSAMDMLRVLYSDKEMGSLGPWIKKQGIVAKAEAEGGLALAVAVPQGIFNGLAPEEIEKLEEIPGVRIVVVEGDTKEKMLAQLEEVREREGMLAGALVDLDIKSADIINIVSEFSKEVKDRVFVLGHPELVKITPETIGRIQGLPELLKDISNRYLDRISSLDVNSMGIYQLRVSQVYKISREGDRPRKDRVEYSLAALDSRSEHFLVHYADGSILMDAKQAIIPPGLEIQRRREAMKTARDTDVQHDKFMVMAPEGVVTENEKDAFKRQLMRYWMIEGIVDPADVVILDRKAEGYGTTELFGLIRGAEARATVVNTGFRTIAGILAYDENAASANIVQVDLAPGASSNFNQYEIFVNLLLSADRNEAAKGVPGLELAGEGKGLHFIYLPQAKAIDLEDEIRNYDRYVKEVLVRA